jgi:hypothetical protein
MANMHEDFQSPPAHATQPLPCRHCGAVAMPVLTQGTGPHAFRANCASCGRFIQRISRSSPAERARRQAHAMATLAPTALQLQGLRALGDTLPAPVNRDEAARRIVQLSHNNALQQKDGRRV